MYTDMDWWTKIRLEVSREESSKRGILRREGISWDTLKKKYAKQLIHLNGQLAKYGYNYLLFLRIVPLLPFCVVNYLAGIAKIPVKSFILATSLGVLPWSLFLTYAGQHLSTINRVGDLLSPSFYLALSGLAILALLPVLISHHRKPAEGP